MRRAAALLALLLAVPAIAAAGGAGSTGANGLKLSAGARPEGMGGAFTGLADDLSALFWNPAGLATIRRPMGSLMHTAYLADTSYDVVALAMPLGRLGTLGGAVNMLNYGSLPRLNRGSLVQSGTFSSADTFILAGYGMSLPPVFGLNRLRAGVVTKLTFQELTDETQTGLALAGGLLWDSPVEGLRVGTMVDNAGALVGGEGGMLPLNWRVGGSWSRAFSPWLSGAVAADTVVLMDTGFQGGAGVEFVAYRILSLRGGWRGGGAEGGPTFGLGLGYPARVLNRELVFKLDYAAASHGMLGTAHRIQLTVAFGSGLPPRMGSVSISGEGPGSSVSWTGPGPAYRVEAMPEWNAAWQPLSSGPVQAGRVALSSLRPGSWRVRVTTVDPDRPDWTGEAKETAFTMPAPQLVLKVVGGTGAPALAWEGGVGPGYHVIAVTADDPEPLRVTEAPVPASSYSLAGVPPGEYEFHVTTVDGAQPAWKGPVSNTVKVVIDAGVEK